MSKKYFFTKDSHSCPLNSLSPDEIKKSYTKELSKYDIQRMSYYNSAARTLGFQDWTKYQIEYEEKVVPFLKKNSLTRYAPNYNIKIYKAEHDIYFSYRQIADRIFLSKEPIPKKIFTGYDCKTDNYDYWKFQYPFPTDDIKLEFSNSDEKLIINYLKKLEESISYQTILKEQELDYLIPSFSDFLTLMNLIGDTFIINEKEIKSHVIELYDSNIGLAERDYVQEFGDFIHSQLKKLKKGWIEVIPFNDNLVFFKTIDGTYDFVFKGLRDSPFQSKFNKYIRTKNMPSLVNESYDFERWLYFGFKEKKKNIIPFDIWKERDSHLAEIEYYKNNSVENYPSQFQLLKNYYSKNGIYKYDKKTSNRVLESFSSFEFQDKILYVSNLISIREFVNFYYEKDEKGKSYQETRLDTLDNLGTVNDEENLDLPVSVTWYDAIAYCRYLEKKHDIHPRLITIEEYSTICPSLSLKEFDKNNEELCSKYDNDKEYYAYAYDREELEFTYNNEKVPTPPPHIVDFDNVIMKYAKPLEYIENNGLRFCINTSFVEWSNECNGDVAKRLSARYPDYNITNGYIRNILPAYSTLKYKYRKAGFRVCYEMLKDIK